jgi:hypothetical protein
MKSKEPQLLKKIIDIICESCKAHCDSSNILQSPFHLVNQFGIQSNQQTVSSLTNIKNEQF